MKIITRNHETLIYPFLAPRERPTVLMGRIVVYDNGLIRLDEFDKMTMSADIAETLTQALNKAIEIAQNKAISYV